MVLYGRVRVQARVARVPRAVFGFALVAISQLVYFVGGMAFGGFGARSLLTLLSLLCALACVAGEALPNREVVAWGLGVFALAEVFDYALTLGSLNVFFFGFTVFVVGLVLAALGAWRWAQEPVEAPRPFTFPLGAWLAVVGAGIYILGNILGTFSVFGIGAVAAASGWSMVARSA